MSEIRIFSALSDKRFSEHAGWIAIIIATWARVEEQFEHIHYFLLSRDTDTSKITFWAIQNHRTRLNIITSGFAHFYPDSKQFEEWKRLQKGIKTAYQHRNTVAHAIWERDGRTGGLRLKSTVIEGALIRREKLYSLNNLRNQADFVSRIGGDVSELAVSMLILRGHR